jgi:hypothetical protein
MEAVHPEIGKLLLDYTAPNTTYQYPVKTEGIY